ncbi:DUF1178 family protein [Castellaniella sp.]|uniref:DUF1178 family protein n=1 Tax=Castellaniella sp. TaxID=1955812 RepID=UPI0035656B64
MTIKVFDLSCEHDHLFEGWFASAQAFEDQQARGLVRCPVCQSMRITRRVSAPHLNVSHLREQVPAQGQQTLPQGRAAVAAPSVSQLSRMQAEVLRQMRRILQQSDDVGVRFADEARRMHEGEIAERPIRGTATAEECKELVEEGISIMPIPEFLDDDRLQ